MDLADVSREAPVIILSAPSALGHLAVAVVGDALSGVAFAHRSAASAAGALARRTSQQARGGADCFLGVDAEELAADVLERLQRYAEGEPVDFSDVPVALDHLSTFQRRVIKACRGIGRGEQRTYGELAAIAGSPGAARAVGQVMAANRTPLVVPCHRVVAAGGGLGGFSAPQGLTMKRRLLELETDAVGAS